MITKKNFQIRTGSDYGLDVDIFSLADLSPQPAKAGTGDGLPLVIFTHGFKGFKDWGGFPYMMERIASAGFVSASFNFSHNGVDHKHPQEFTRLDLFAENTFSLELEELEIVIDHFYNNAEKFNISNQRITLIGHSRGGGISIIKASEDKRVKCLVTLAAVSTFGRYTDEPKALWRKQGYIETLNTRTNQMMRLNVGLLDDIEKNRSRFDIIAASKKINIPFLIIHGKEDLSVRYEEAVDLYEAADKQYAELYPVNNTGHTFGVVHPFAGTTTAFEMVINKVIEFLKKNL